MFKIIQRFSKINMADIIVATGASIIDMDLFEGLGNKHYIGSSKADDNILRENILIGYTTHLYQKMI